MQSLGQEANNKVSLRFYKNLTLIAIMGAVFINIFVLFYSPMPGVADQGDFQRVMSVTGLAETGKSAADHWFKYVTTDYKRTSVSFLRLIGIIPTTSMIYPIYAARILSIIIGQQHFSTNLLAAIYAVMYILAFYICLKYINFKRKSTAVFFVVLSLFIFMDGGYLIWFNSLYGEPMMIIGFLYFIGAMLYLIRHLENKSLRAILFAFISSILFLGAKLQCFVALPIIILLVARVTLFNGIKKNRRSSKLYLIFFSAILIFYVSGIYVQMDGSTGIDTKYNSVFYGILKDSSTPKQDLVDLGLSPDMSVEAGKNAYLPKSQYAKYAPWSDLTMKEFNDKISNLKLMKFYLTHPTRLIDGMEYTASKCFNTMGFLGKYKEEDIKEYTYSFHRFTLWSDFRSNQVPKKLIFLILFYILVISISFFEYARKKEQRLFIELVWTIIIIGLLQFLMPYIGNGEADTAKQLFLFNFTFDIVFLVACTWIFDRAVKLIRK